ncbi:hypothetical protein C8J55DRAFT_518978 [Lentinula edodes]|uniref:Uncharacterized protein n=1 Tax=Lentinula lateritia TaxID=40482 RepID=A0A9W9DK24_9AGAR|nr:hypothetical protein C8J55DRAFT_518978 [Lentinula edodes]
MTAASADTDPREFEENSSRLWNESMSRRFCPYGAEVSMCPNSGIYFSVIHID